MHFVHIKSTNNLVYRMLHILVCCGMRVGIEHREQEVPDGYESLLNKLGAERGKGTPFLDKVLEESPTFFAPALNISTLSFCMLIKIGPYMLELGLYS